MFFVIAALGLTAFFSGGVNSSWYLALLFAIVTCAALGYRAVYLNLFWLVAFFSVDIVFNLLRNPDSSFQFRVFPITLAALVCAWLVAYSTESQKTAKAGIEKFGAQLDRNRLSERSLLASIAEPMISLDANLKILLMNQAAQNLSGWDVGDAVGLDYHHVFNLQTSDDQKAAGPNDPFALALSHKTTISTARLHMVRSKDKLKIPLDISIAPSFNQASEVVALVAIMRDISKQQELERQRNEFVSTASHEMRTPVATIEGYIAMAANPKTATIDERAQKYLQRAHESAVHLGKLFQDLLSVSKIEDKDYKSERVLFNLTDLVLKIAGEMRPLAVKKGLDISTHIGGATMGGEKVIVPAYPVYASPEGIGEVLTNLIDNAIKYTQTGLVEVIITGGEGNVTITVADSGMGISKQEQKHIFEKFYRVNNDLTREQPGTGLGLFITRNIIEASGGRIWVESDPGKGARFSFMLPVVKKVAN